MYEKISLAAAGSTGTVTGAATDIQGYRAMAFQFAVEATGATPTITFKFQGSLDGTAWYDVGYVTDISDTTVATAVTKTAVGTFVYFLANPEARRYKQWRVVVSANTNITFRAEAWRISDMG